MKRYLLLVMALLALCVPLAAAQDDNWPRTVLDGFGNAVTLSAPPQRIVSLSLAADETLLPVIGPERFAAVTSFALDPALSNVAVAASEVEQVIVSAQDTEQIIALNPDLVIAASFTEPEVLQQLRDAGVPVFVTDFATSFEAVRENARALAAAVGAEDAVEARLAQMDAEIAAVTAAVDDQPPQRVLFLTPGNYSSGVGSTISEIIAAAGGIDITEAAGIEQAAPVSDEFIIEQNPDVILLTGWTPYDPTFVDTFRSNPAFTSLSAIQNDRVFVAHDAHLTTVSPDIFQGVKDVASFLHPDQYPAFPLTLTDAAGRTVTVAEEPSVVFSEGEGTFGLVDGLLRDWGLAVPHGAAVDDVVGRVVVFTKTAPLDTSVSAVVLHTGDSPAEIVANALLVGEALGERARALAWVGQYTDGLETQPAGS